MDIAQLVQDVEDGKENPLKAYALLKDHMKFVSEAIAQFEDYAQEEAAKFGAKTFETMGWKFEIRNGARRHSFKHIDEWLEVNTGLKEREKLYKAAAAAAEKRQTIVDENGEVVPPSIVTFSKDSLIVTPLT